MSDNPHKAALERHRNELARLNKESDLWKHGFESGTEWAVAAILDVAGHAMGTEATEYARNMLKAAKASIKQYAETYDWPGPRP